MSARLHGLIWAQALAVAFVATSQTHAANIAEATALFKSGQYAECIAACDDAINKNQYSETWRVLKIRGELALGLYQEAQATLVTALEKYQTSVRLRWLGYRVFQLNGQPVDADEMLGQIDTLMDGGSWRYSDPASRVALGEFYLQRGVDPKQVLDALFKRVKKYSPSYAGAFISSGQLALDKHDYALAAEEFEGAIKLDATNPEVHLGIAKAYAPSDPEKLDAALKAALQLNSQHVDTLLFYVDNHIDAERYETARELLTQVMEVNVLEPRAWAYRAVLAHLDNNPVEEELCRDMALSWWSTNPEVDHLIGRKLSQKYRFAEGAKYQRRALEHQRDYLPALFQLSQDLLRLGKSAEGWQLADLVNQQDGYNVVAHNLVKLKDNMQRFRTLTSDGLVVRMEAREAGIYGQLVLDLLSRARDQLCEKYDIALDEPTYVEIFDQQPDFAIRTFGLPGGAGFLGVCFGRVITANSPASQKTHPTNWQATLWHEYCHVVTLQKTNNKMPRWLSEGISVYEERQANATWGERMTPQYRAMILGDDLTPVSQLSSAFLQPPSPIHLQFAYYESSLVVEYLIEKYGVETLKQILVDLGAGLSVNESLQRYAGSLDALDAEFAEYARKLASDYGPGVDWEEPDVSQRAGVGELAMFVREHPTNFVALQRYAASLMRAKAWEQAKTPLNKLIELFPDYRGSDSAYAMLAVVHRELNETNEERAALERQVELTADSVDAHRRLAELAADSTDWSTALTHAERMLAVDPLQKTPYRLLARAAEQLNDDAHAITALGALSTMDPVDPADVYYRLGAALQREGRLPAARFQTLRALEEAPRFRAAHRQLLDIVRLMDDNAETTSPAGEAATPPAEGR